MSSVIKPSAAVILATATLATAGLLATPAHAVVDPAAVLCMAESTADITALIDPAAPGLPAEIPLASCLAP